MNTICNWRTRLGLPLALLLSLLLHGCATDTPRVAPAQAASPIAYPIRFLLTFDDGPSIRTEDNPTLAILDALADNPIQPGIKAIFFVQTRAVNGGGTPFGREILQREHASGHLLAFHTATPHHTNHRALSNIALDQSLQDGIADTISLTGAAPRIVRPPFWSVDERVAAAYRRHGLQLLMTHLNANDGKIYGINFSLRRRSNLYKQLAGLEQQIRNGALPVVDGEIPIIVTFHDINSYTARHMKEYLEILTESAQALGLRTAAKPFYDERGSVERAALASTVAPGKILTAAPSLWRRLWQ